MFRTLLIITVLAPTLAMAAPSTDLLFGGDYFAAGPTAELAQPNAKDAFLAGEYATVTAAVAGNVHAAARTVRIDGPVGQNLYAVEQDVLITQPIAGHASLGGYSIRIDDNIGGNLRAGGRNLTLNGTVGGNALLTAKDLHIQGTIEGGALIRNDNLTFGSDALINGKITLYQRDSDSRAIPESVAEKDSLTVKPYAGWNFKDTSTPWAFWADLGSVRCCWLR